MNKEILEIIKYPAPILREKCKLLEDITVEEARLFENMVFAMRNFKGVGLAAPQIGILSQLLVFEAGERVIKLANPEILSFKGKDRMVEGCLSVPYVNVEVERPFEVTVKGLNENGRQVELILKGMPARVLLHEIDHLNGRLIIDYMSLIGKVKFKLIKKCDKRKR